MKKVLYPIAMLAIAAIGVFVINACKKTETGINTLVAYQGTEFMPNSNEVEPLILDFNQSYQSYQKGMKSGAETPLEEALWTLEAGVNYEFRSSKDSIGNIIYDTTYVTASIFVDENGSYLVPDSELMEAYDELLAGTNAVLNSGSEESLLLLADVSISSIENDKVNFAMVSGRGVQLPRQCEVKSDDYWYGLWGDGQCGSYIGQNMSLDAADRIGELINGRHCSLLSCANGGSVYFTHIESIELHYGENGWLFYHTQNPFSECFEPSDIS